MKAVITIGSRNNTIGSFGVYVGRKEWDNKYALREILLGGKTMNGIAYLFKFTWKFRKKYIIFSFLQQLISSLVPLMLIVIPAQIIDELLGDRSMSVIFGYVAVMVTAAFFNNAVCAWLRKECTALKGLLFVDF